MKFSGRSLRFYLVTDRSWLKPGETLAQQVEQALLGGATMVQLREKTLSREMILAEARELLALCHRFGVPLILNDDPQLALEAGADGVHIGQEDMAYEQARKLLGPDKIIGVSAHNPREALAAQEAGADYLGCGAVFGSSTKDGVQTLTPEGLREICSTVKIPVVAIGGINETNLPQLKGCGAYGAAVISAFFAKENKQMAACQLSELTREVFQPHFHGMKTALTIAGSDSSGGAGIQADLKTMTAHGVYGMSAITALTAQNTTGVSGVLESTPEFLKMQLDSVFTDIFPDAVKNRHGKQCAPDSHHRRGAAPLPAKICGSRPGDDLHQRQPSVGGRCVTGAAFRACTPCRCNDPQYSRSGSPQRPDHPEQRGYGTGGKNDSRTVSRGDSAERRSSGGHSG